MAVLTQALDPWLLGISDDWATWSGKVTTPTRSHVLELAIQISRPISGDIVEFGSFQGYSARILRDELWRTRLWEPRQWRKRIYACDSFEGLSESYEHLAAGTFKTDVPTLRGIRIVKGYFEDSLTPELAAKIGRVSLAHIDCDLYSSTVTVLKWLTPLLRPGSLLLFDEFLGEDPAEARAFVEWSAESGIQTMLLALFAREPSGKGPMTDRRALFQVVGDAPLVKAKPLPLVRWRRRLSSTW